VLSGPRLTALSATAAAALLLGTAGCTHLDQASAAGITHDDLLSEMSVQLARVTGLTYSATYQLTGGDTATVTQAQKPTRTAYVYPGGRLIETATGTVRCIGDQPGAKSSGETSGKAAGKTEGATDDATGGTTASVTSGATAGKTEGATSGATAGKTEGVTSGKTKGATSGKTEGATSDKTGGDALACTETDPAPATTTPLAGSALITPAAALAMLNTAALDEDVDATQHDTTIAGRHAICLDLDNVDGTPTRRFSLCVTIEGALGSFAATIAGTHYEQALTAYSETAAPEAFKLPPMAKLSDKRTK
jgi:hypothetical protein